MNDPARRQPARILDANANRAREAMRVLEDGARFLLEDEAVSGRLKALRHDLVAALGGLPAGLLQSHRDVSSDPGRELSVPSESTRSDARAVLEAAGGRLGEALRSLEEWSKIVDPEVAQRLEAIRYRGYEAAGDLLQRLPDRSVQWRLCVLVTRSACRREPAEVVRAAVAGGADCLQVREKGLDDRAQLEWIREVVALARPSGTAVVVNDRVDLALAAGADGVHLGTGDLPISEARRLGGGALLIGASTHDLEEAASAIAAGCDHCGLGTMYASETKPECAPSGPAYLGAFLERHPAVPHLAIGGIDADRAEALAALGARGFAVSGAVCGAEDPEAACRAILAAAERGARVST